MLWTCRKRFCLDLGETDPASSRWFGVPSESAALQFGRTDAPSTPPLRCPIQPRRLQPGEAHRPICLSGADYWGSQGPLMLLVVIALKLESHSAVFERQNCIAAGGRRFQMLKFRTRRDPDTAPSGLDSARRVPPPDTHRSTADAD